jgi:hypothetical protein
MRSSQSSALLRLSLSCLGLVLALTPEVWAGSRWKVLYHFDGGNDGAAPNAMILGPKGNLYGTAQGGGDSTCVYYYSGCGVVFEMTRSSKGEWQEVVLYSFQGGPDGGLPVGNLASDASGNLYGTTTFGGTGSCQLGCGTVFELSPSQNSWTETVLYSFQNGSDGAYPNGLTFDASGNLFGVNRVSGEDAIFEISPARRDSAAWTETTIYYSGGSTLSSNLIFHHGLLYETYPAGYPQQFGEVFDLQQVGQSWQETDLFGFKGGGNGGKPESGIIFDNRGRMYGTAVGGGNDWGIAFELRLSAGQWKQVMLHNFCSWNNCADGALPSAPLTFDRHGNLYGMTAEGGTGNGNGCTGCGVVFELSPTMTGRWKETVLHDFQGKDGEGTSNSLILDNKGNIYGIGSGIVGLGMVFELTP